MKFYSVNVPRRFIVCTLLFFGLFIAYALRINLSIAIVKMTSDHPVQLANGTTIQVKDFDWDPKLKGYILSSFFYGYVVSEMTGGWLAGKFGGATIIGMAILFGSIFTFIMPFSVAYGPYAITSLRALAGVFEGGVFPCTYAIWSKWAPLEQRTLLTSISFSGINFSNIVCFFAYGFIADYLSWKLLFYIPGILGLLWCAMWFYTVKNDPVLDPNITSDEVLYIQSELHTIDSKKITYPWKKIFTSLPVWAIISQNFCECWGHYTLLTMLPTFLNDLWGVPVKDSGLLFSITFIPVCVLAPFVGIISDYLRKEKGYSTTSIRKGCCIIAYIGQAVSISLITFSGTPVMVIAYLSLFMFFGTFSYGSFFVNHLDIAPNYSSVLMGISNTFGSVAGVFAPAVAGHIASNRYMTEWRMVFFLCGGMYIASTIFYIIFGSGELQPWAYDQTSNKSEKKTENTEL